MNMQRLYNRGQVSAWSQLCRLCLVPEFGVTSTAYHVVNKINAQPNIPLLKCGNSVDTRLFHMSTRLSSKHEPVSQDFDDYYTAVTKAVDTSERFQKLKEKFQSLSDPDEQERAIKRWKFIEAVDFYVEQNEKSQRRHTDFIYDALNKMKQYGVHRDLACYKALIKVFPKDVMVAQTKWQVEFMHFPRQQHCAIDIMEKMEDEGVLLDMEFGRMFLPVFGDKSHVVRKFRRTYYWMHKFANKNPYKLPHDLPTDAIQLALLALKKMSVDLENELNVWKVKENSQSVEATFIASAQSPIQQDMIAAHPVDTPLYVEGRYTVWLRDVTQTYFVLRADSDPSLFEVPEEDVEDLCNFETIFDSEDPKELIPRLNDHQQEEGTILAMCITGTSSKDSLISWIRCLQQQNPKLEKIPIVFSLVSGEDSVVPVSDSDQTKVNVMPT